MTQIFTDFIRVKQNYLHIFTPFVLSLSKHPNPFDKLRANGISMFGNS